MLKDGPLTTCAQSTVEHGWYACLSWQSGGMSEVTLVGLRVVHEVLATGSFTSAAESLDYTQSAVSRQVAAIEQAVGARLFERGPRGVEPTPAGQVLARWAGRVSAELGAVSREIVGLRDRLSGRVAIGAFPTAAAVLVPRAVAQLVRDHPAISVTFDEAGSPVLMRRLRAERLEIAVVSVGHGLAAYDMSDLRQELLVDNDLRVAVPEGHRLAKRRRVLVDDLRDEDWIIGQGRRGDPQFGAWPTLPQPRVAFTAREWLTRLGMVAAGLGVCLIPGLAVDSVPSGVRVASVIDQHWLGRATVAVTWQGRSTQTDAAVQALKEQASRLSVARPTP